MVRRGDGQGKGTSKGNASANRGAQASSSSSENESKSKQKEELVKTATEEKKRKTKEIERFQMDSPAMTKSTYSVEKMVRRGDGRGKGTSKGNASANRGAQASSSSMENESKSKQKEELLKTATEEKKRKTKEIERFQMDSPAMSTRAKVAKDKRMADMDVCTLRFNKSTVNASSKKLGGIKKKSISDARTDVSKMESSVGANSKLSPKKETLTDKVFLDPSSPLPAETDGLPPLSKVLQASKQEVDEQKRNLDPIATKGLEVLSLVNEKKLTKSNKQMDEFIHMLKRYTEYERKLNVGLKQRQETDYTKKTIEGKFDVEELVPMLWCSQDIDERKLNLHLTSPKFIQEISSENEKEELESITEGNESTPQLQSSKDIEERMENLNLKTSSMQLEFRPENEKKVAKQKPEVDVPTSLLQVLKLLDVNEIIQNIDLSTSIAKKNISAEHMKKLIRPETEEHEDIIHLKRDANLRFEVDTFGNKKVLVDDTDQYTANEKQKLTFNIGDGNMQLSFIENKVCIFTERGEIDCSIRKNQVIFSLKDSSAVSDFSPEVPSTNELSHGKNTEVFKYLDSTNITGTSEKRPFLQSQEMHLENGFKDVHMSTQQTNLPLVPSSVVQQCLQNITNSFLDSFTSSLHNYETGFVEGLKKGNNEFTK